MKFLRRISTDRIFLTITAIYVAGYLAHALYLKKTVYGDGIYYYAWLTNLTPSKFSVGPALFWFPIYSLTHNQIAVGMTGVLASLFSLILLYHLLSKTFSRTVSIMTVAAIAGTTNLFFYGSLDTVNSHALTFFAATIFLTLVSMPKKQWFAIGFFLGILGLIRPQDLVYGLILLPLLSKKNIFPIFAGAVIAMIPQFTAWQHTTGSFWLSPYVTGHEGFNFLRPQILGVLFNLQDGLFLWTPITALGVAGLLYAKKYWFLAVFLLELYIVASWSTWWQGASYSGRMFVSSLPLLAFGVASIFSWLAKKHWSMPEFILIFVGPLTFINVSLICSFLLFH